MKRVIDAALNYYNANTKYNSTGDCVKRSLSLAYGMDYDDVSKELNQIKRRLGYSVFNVSPVYNEFMVIHGLAARGDSKLFKVIQDFGYNKEDIVTVEDFSNKFNQGTYIIVCGKTKQSNTHMVCILNGDIYDSWDCSKWSVNKIYVIESKSNSVTIDSLNIKDIESEVETYLMDYLNSISEKKMQWAHFVVSKENSSRIDRYGYQLMVGVICDDATCDQLGIRSGGNINEYHDFMIRINPRLDLESNLNKIKEKIRYQAREWSWAFRKKVEDIIQTNNMKTHPKFHGDKKLLLKIPEEFRDKVINFYDRGNNEFTDRYYLEMEADLEDPRYTEEDHTVFFYAESLKELKGELEDYKADFSRYGYDY